MAYTYNILDVGEMSSEEIMLKAHIEFGGKHFQTELLFFKAFSLLKFIILFKY